MKDSMHRSQSHHKRKHYDSDERKVRRKHRKHKSKDELSEVEVMDNRESSQKVADVIEIHGSSSEEGEISDSEEEVQSHRRKHTLPAKVKREKESPNFAEEEERREARRRCKKHRRHREKVSELVEDKKHRKREADDVTHRRKKKDREIGFEQVIKKEPDDEELVEQPRLRVKPVRDSDDRDRRGSETSSRQRSRERPTKTETQVKEERQVREEVETRVKEERADRAGNEPNPGTSSGTRRNPRVEDNTEYDWGTASGAMSREAEVKQEPNEKDKPDFKLSGKLTEDRNMFNGVVVKYSEPPESRMPKKRWRLYPFKGEQVMPTLYIHRQSAYLIGRDRKVADLPIDHPSCSKQHAALQYRLVSYNKANGLMGKAIRLYIIDLESANGTFVNNKKIESKKYVELLEKDVIKFGFSSREYVLLHEGSKGDESDDE